MKLFTWANTLLIACLAFIKTKVDIVSPYLGTPKLTGFDNLDILSVWVNAKYSGCNIVLLTDINVEAKDLEFWARIPKGQAMEFLKDIVILRCKDKTEIKKLIPSIGSKFALAYGFSNGKLILSNKDAE
jgi:hypothetical protein